MKITLDYWQKATVLKNLWGINHDFYCILQDDEAYYGLYNGSGIDTCRACWLKWLSKESEEV